MKRAFVVVLFGLIGCATSSEPTGSESEMSALATAGNCHVTEALFDEALFVDLVKTLPAEYVRPDEVAVPGAIVARPVQVGGMRLTHVHMPSDSVFQTDYETHLPAVAFGSDSWHEPANQPARRLYDAIDAGIHARFPGFPGWDRPSKDGRFGCNDQGSKTGRRNSCMLLGALKAQKLDDGNELVCRDDR